MSADPEALDRAFHALADPSRRAIVARLARGPASVSTLAEPLPMSLPAVGQHVRVLDESGLISTRKVGRVRACQLEPAALAPIERWLSEHRGVWAGRLDRLDALLADET